MAEKVTELPGRPIDAKTRAVLKINGRQFDTWKSINAQRSIAQIAGTFSFTTSNRFAGDVARWGFTTGDSCTVSIGDNTILTGYLDDIDDGYSLNTHDVTFTGRDKTEDLVDCAYDTFTLGSQLKNLTVLQIIKKLCDPFGISVEVDDSTVKAELSKEKVPVYNIEIGDKVYSMISTLCQQYAILPITTGDGKLRLTRTGIKKANDILEVGKNILANRLNQSDKDRFSVYYATGPAKTSAFNSKLIVNGKLSDNYVKRTRPLVILVGEQANSDDVLQKRAAWEARIRAGGSRKVQTKVRGWTQSNGDIWPLNGLVSVKDDKIGVNGEFLIASINFSLDGSGGELTNMSLVPPEAFDLQKRTDIPNKKVSAWDKLKTQQ